MRRLLVLWALVALALAAGAVALALRAGTEEDPAPQRAGLFRGSEPPPGIRLPDFSLRDHTGGLVRSDELRGKVVVLTFLDTQCTESCPVIAAAIGRTIDALAEVEREQVAALAISTDPREDTPASVRAFLRRQRADGRLRYLTGPEAAIRAAWRSFMVVSSSETGMDSLHSAPVRVYGPQGTWLSTLHAGADLSADNLVYDIRAAFRKGRLRA